MSKALISVKEKVKLLESDLYLKRASFFASHLTSWLALFRIRPCTTLVCALFSTCECAAYSFLKKKLMLFLLSDLPCICFTNQKTTIYCTDYD